MYREDKGWIHNVPNAQQKKNTMTHTMNHQFLLGVKINLDFFMSDFQTSFFVEKASNCEKKDLLNA